MKTLPRPLRLRYPELIDWEAVDSKVTGHLRDLARVAHFKQATVDEAARRRLPEAIRPPAPIRIPTLDRHQAVILARHETFPPWIAVDPPESMTKAFVDRLATILRSPSESTT